MVSSGFDSSVGDEKVGIQRHYDFCSQNLNWHSLACPLLFKQFLFFSLHAFYVL